MPVLSNSVSDPVSMLVSGRISWADYISDLELCEKMNCYLTDTTIRCIILKYECARNSLMIF